MRNFRRKFTPDQVPSLAQNKTPKGAFCFYYVRILIMNKLKVVKDAVVFVKKSLAGEGTGHDWWHIERVWNNAKNIHKTEKGDRFVIDLAVLLHDVGDRKVIKRDEDDYAIASNFLESKNVPPQIIEQVVFIIKNISFSNTLNNKPQNFSKEFYIVQDADRLDALGAIGIARLFAFGGSKGRPLYDPSKIAQIVDTKENYRKMESSSFHHFYEKILLLKNLMNTKTAKKIAQKRHDYIEKYMRQFLLEWEGKRWLLK